jgi:pyruvate dehydrogenase E2 component (dihydrolipoamide acetyltransferase)
MGQAPDSIARSEFRMPSLGADMEAGTVVEWRVHPGDAVQRGDIVALVETEKGLIEVEIFETGVIDTIVVSEGQKVPVGTVLATVRVAGVEVTRAAAPPRPAAAAPPPAAPQPVAPAPPPIALRPQARAAGRLRASPLAQRRAAELGMDLAAVTGTGEGGAITASDVERAAKGARPEGPAAAPAVDRQAAMRRAIGAAMARSKREIPHYYLGTTIDMSRAMTWLAAENLKRPITNRLLHSALLVRSVALAVHEVPEMNGFWIDGAFKPGEGVHVGVAISLRGGGLVAPAIHDVDRLGLDEVMQRMLDLVKRARTGILRSSEVSDATITVTNLGEQGVESVFGVIYPPQVALVGFGKVVERPWAAGGMIGVHPVIAASLSADHRASDGHRGGRFLAAIDRLLQEPSQL